MQKLDSHKALSDYVLKKLGQGAVNVEITDDQMDIVIFDAVSFFLERHNDGLEEVLVTANIDSFVLQDGYVELPDEIVGVSKILDTSNDQGTTDAFDRLNYLIANSEILSQSQDLSGIETYVSTVQNIAEIRYFFRPFQDYDFNKASNRLWFRTDMSRTSRIAILGYRQLDPDYDVELYNDIWLRKYAEALAMVQWGRNLTKYIGMDMPGNGQINGEGILQQGLQLKQEAEEEFELKYAAPSLPRVI